MCTSEQLYTWLNSFPAQAKISKAQVQKEYGKLSLQGRQALGLVINQFSPQEDCRVLKEQVAAVKAQGYEKAADVRLAEKREAVKARLAELQRDVNSKSMAVAAQRAHSKALTSASLAEQCLHAKHKQELRAVQLQAEALHQLHDYCKVWPVDARNLKGTLDEMGMLAHARMAPPGPGAAQLVLSDVRELAGEVRQEMEPQINDALTAHSAMRATADAACMARQLSRSNRGAGRGRGSESPDNIHAGALVPLQEASRSSLMSEASGSLVQYGEYDKLASQTAMLGQLDLRLDVRSAAHRRIVELLGHATSPALIRDALCKLYAEAEAKLSRPDSLADLHAAMQALLAETGLTAVPDPVHALSRMHQEHFQLFQEQVEAEMSEAEEKHRLHVLLASPGGQALLATPSGKAVVQKQGVEALVRLLESRVAQLWAQPESVGAAQQQQQAMDEGQVLITGHLGHLQATNMAAQMHCEKANAEIHQRQSLMEGLCRVSLPDVCGQLARHSAALRPLLETAPSALLAVPPALLPDVLYKRAQRNDAAANAREPGKPTVLQRYLLAQPHASSKKALTLLQQEMASEGASRRQSLGPGQRPIGMSTTGGSTASLPGALLPDSSAYGHSTAHLRGRRPGGSSSRIGSTDVLGHAVLGVPSVACILASMLQGTDPLAPMRCPGGLLLRMADKLDVLRALRQLHTTTAAQVVDMDQRNTALSQAADHVATGIAAKQHEETREMAPRLQRALAELGRSGIEMRERIDRALSDQERLPAMSLLPHLRQYELNCAEWYACVCSLHRALAEAKSQAGSVAQPEAVTVLPQQLYSHTQSPAAQEGAHTIPLGAHPGHGAMHAVGLQAVQENGHGASCTAMDWA